MDNPSAGKVFHSLGYLQTHVCQSFLHFTDLKQITSNIINLDFICMFVSHLVAPNMIVQSLNRQFLCE